MPRHWAMSLSAPCGVQRPVCNDGRVNRTVDYSALIHPVSKEQVAEFRRRARASGTSWGAGLVAGRFGLVGGGVLIAIMAVVQLGTVVSSIGTAADTLTADSIGKVILPIFFLAVFLFVGFITVRGLFAASPWETWYRLEGFAHANGLMFSADSHGPNYPGAIFTAGRARRALNQLFSVTGRHIAMGNHRYVTGSGKSSTTHTWGYLAIQLERSLPHMVLDARANNNIFGDTALASTLSKSQVLSLEGDFDRHFTLYCPEAYERDALYVFTPDLMALLIDEAAPFDVEIVDDWMFVYSPTPFAGADPHLYQRLFRIVDTVGAKTLARTNRYADERIGDPSIDLVAPQGQRLKRGAVTGKAVIVMVFAIAWVMVNFGSRLSS